MNEKTVDILTLLSRLWPEMAVVRAPEGGRIQAESLKAFCTEALPGMGPRKVVGVLLEGRVPDAVMLASPPPSPPRWVFVIRQSDGSYLCHGWGWTINDETKRLFDLKKAERIIAEAIEIIDKFLASSSDLYMTLANVGMNEADHEAAQRAMRLAVEQNDRCRLLDVDGQEVLCRAIQRDEPVRRNAWIILLKRIMARIRRRPYRTGPDRAKLEEARVRLAVREDRCSAQIEQLCRDEEAARAGRQGEHPPAEQASVDQVEKVSPSVAQLRQRISEMKQLREVVRSQRSGIEMCLHHLDMMKLGAAVDLPGEKELLDKGLEIARMIEQAQDRTFLVRAAREHASRYMPVELEPEGNAAAVSEVLNRPEQEAEKLDVLENKVMQTFKKEGPDVSASESHESRQARREME